MENFFYQPLMSVIKYHKFLEVKPKYDMKEVRLRNMSFGPEVYQDMVFYFVKATDFLISEEDNDYYDMIVPYENFKLTIDKVESLKFISSFKREVLWSLQTKEM